MQSEAAFACSCRLQAAWSLASHLTPSSPSQSNKVILLEQHEMLHRLGSSHGESRIIRRTYPQLSYTEMMEEAYQLWHEVERQGSSSSSSSSSIQSGARDVL